MSYKGARCGTEKDAATLSASKAKSKLSANPSWYSSLNTVKMIVHAYQSFGKDGSFCRIFLHIIPFQIINPENSMTFFEDSKLWNHHFFMYAFPPSNYFSDTGRESDFVLSWKENILS